MLRTFLTQLSLKKIAAPSCNQFCTQFTRTLSKPGNSTILELDFNNLRLSQTESYIIFHPIEINKVTLIGTVMGETLTLESGTKQFLIRTVDADRSR